MTTKADIIELFMYRARELCRELGIEVPYFLVAFATEWLDLGIGLDFAWRRCEFELRYKNGDIQSVDDYLRQRRAQRILAQRQQEASPCEEPGEPLQVTQEPEPHLEPPQGRPTTKADRVRHLLRETVGRGPVPAIKLQKMARQDGLLRQGQEIGRCSTFRRVAKELRIKSKRTGYGPGAQYIWRSMT
jgi:hypothetical protein